MRDNVIRLPLTPNQALPDREDRDWVISTELQAEAGITYRQLDYWCRTGLLTSIEDPTPGSGHVRRFADAQLERAKAIRGLLTAGVETRVIRDHIDEFLTHGHIQIGDITITRTPGDAA